MGKAPEEREIKLKVGDLRAVLQRLQGIGFHEARPRVHERNSVFDTREQALREQEKLLRVRQVDSAVVVTYKGPGKRGCHKVREEVEFHVDDAAGFERVLEELGFHRSFRYEKYRTEYEAEGGSGVVTVDETPIGNFVELEGPEEWIDQTAKELGYSENDYITGSYGRLFLEHCERTGVSATDMVFPEGKS
jgi:adenylate cyclase, class 2